ncbi:MAG TPA: PLP-dependent aminotransferase family protein [Hyphomicrobiaceae bacterium]|jgi:DNA-binding transcriptional MocR family regulator|nr:PLP-dependent aminotransferase family protein [Hyphomicrobiaceae bacterium]
MAASEIRELLKVLDRPGIVSFAGGIPDPALFPIAEAKTAYAAVLGSVSNGLQYSVSEGYLPLRQWIARHMGTLGVPCDADNIVVTCGSQQGLEFLGRLLLSPGDTALVTAPTYLGALQAFSGCEPRYDQLRPEDGNRTSASYADAARGAGGAVKLAYVVPSFANPTGETLSLAARERLLDLAGALDVPVIEDAAYVMLQLEGEPVPSMLALEIERRGSIESSRAIYCGTFSKVLAPGLRVGWIVAPKALIRRLVLIKQASDLNSATINQMVMHRMAEAAFDAQVERARAHYRRRRDWLLAALERHMPAGVTWTRPHGGLFVWVTLPEGADAAGLLQRSLEEAGVAFVPGGAFYFDGRGRNTLRLSYSLPGEAEIDRGIARLAALMDATA